MKNYQISCNILVSNFYSNGPENSLWAFIVAHLWNIFIWLKKFLLYRLENSFLFHVYRFLFNGYFRLNLKKDKFPKINKTATVTHFLLMISVCTPWKHQLWFFGVFREYRKRPVAWNRSTLSWWRSLSYRNQSLDLLCISIDWFLYDRDLRHERIRWMF